MPVAMRASSPAPLVLFAALGALTMPLVGCSEGPDQRGTVQDESAGPVASEPSTGRPSSARWRVPSSSAEPSVSWTLPYLEAPPYASSADVGLAYTDLGASDSLVAFVAMGGGSSTSSGEDLLVVTFDADTGQRVWQTNLSATLGAVGTWASVHRLVPLDVTNDLGVVVQMDQSTWLVRLAGADGAVIGRQEIPGLRSSVALAGTVVVASGPDGASLVAYDLSAPAELLWTRDASGLDLRGGETSSPAGFCDLTSKVVYIGPDSCHSVTGTNGLLLDAATGESARDAINLVGERVELSRTGEPDVLLRIDAEASEVMAVASDGRKLWRGPVPCTIDATASYDRAVGDPGTLVPCEIAPGQISLLRLADGAVHATYVHEMNEIWGAFVLDDQLFITSSEAAQVLDVDSGEVVLRTPFALPPVDYGLAVSSDYLYYGNASGESADAFELLAVDRQSGTVPWRASISGMPVVLGNHIVVIDTESLSFRGISGL